MKHLTPLLFIWFFVSMNIMPLYAAGALPVYSRVYDPIRDPAADGRAAIALAKQSNRKVLIEVGGDWCSWCHVLDRFIKANPEVNKRLYETFVVLKVNVSEENRNADFMAALPPTMGYPHMYVADTSGAILHSQDTGEFLVRGGYSVIPFMAFLDRWQNHE